MSNDSALFYLNDCIEIVSLSIKRTNEPKLSMIISWKLISYSSIVELNQQQMMWEHIVQFSNKYPIKSRIFFLKLFSQITCSSVSFSLLTFSRSNSRWRKFAMTPRDYGKKSARARIVIWKSAYRNQYVVHRGRNSGVKREFRNTDFGSENWWSSTSYDLT